MGQKPLFPIHQTTLRVTPETLAELRLQASERNRTINSWVVEVLCSSLQRYEVLPFPPSEPLKVVDTLAFVYRIPVDAHDQLVIAAQARGTRVSVEVRDRIEVMFREWASQDMAWDRLKKAVEGVLATGRAGEPGEELKDAFNDLRGLYPRG